MTNFKEVKEAPSDINEHLETMRDLAKDCHHITEMGVRGIVSTWAWLEGLATGSVLIAIDIRHPRDYGGDLEEFDQACKDKGVNFKFIEGDTLKMEIEETDLLFIDTLHEYEQLKEELRLHSDKVRRFLILHDTASCEIELMPVINEFIAQGKWKIKADYKNNNGLLILERC